MNNYAKQRGKHNGLKNTSNKTCWRQTKMHGNMKRAFYQAPPFFKDTIRIKNMDLESQKSKSLSYLFISDHIISYFRSKVVDVRSWLTICNVHHCCSICMVTSPSSKKDHTSWVPILLRSLGCTTKKNCPRNLVGWLNSINTCPKSLLRSLSFNHPIFHHC